MNIKGAQQNVARGPLPNQCLPLLGIISTHLTIHDPLAKQIVALWGEKQTSQSPTLVGGFGGAGGGRNNKVLQAPTHTSRAERGR